MAVFGRWRMAFRMETTEMAKIRMQCDSCAKCSSIKCWDRTYKRTHKWQKQAKATVWMSMRKQQNSFWHNSRHFIENRNDMTKSTTACKHVYHTKKEWKKVEKLWKCKVSSTFYQLIFILKMKILHEIFIRYVSWHVIVDAILHIYFIQIYAWDAVPCAAVSHLSLFAWELVRL